MASKNGNKGTMAFADSILQYLENRADNDALFAVKFANTQKSVDDCVCYIINEVQKSGCNGFTDDEIFGMAITDNELTIKVLESIDEYYEEGTKQDICVFGAGYYRKEDTLILSARIGGEIIETVEVDLKTLKVVQSHGKYNKDTKYHDRIINLVNSNAKLIIH